MKSEKDIVAAFVASQEDYPIWYYKKLTEVDLDYVIWNMLLEPFVVEIRGIRFHFIFGKNRKHEIISTVRNDDLHKNPWTSWELVNKAFREGIWFSISAEDTSCEYRQNYRREKETLKKENLKELAEFIESVKRGR